MYRRRLARERLPEIDKNITLNEPKHHAPIQPPIEEIAVPVASQVVPLVDADLPPPEVKQLDEETCKRSKRMFGHLLGTLKKFKVENETTKDLSIKRQEIEKKHQEREIKEHEEALRQKRELILSRVEKQRTLRELRKQIWIKELEEKSVEYFDHLNNYILLSRDMPIFYAPATHNEATLRRLENTKDIILKRKEEYVKLIPEFPMLNDQQKESINGNELNREKSSSESSSNDEEDIDTNAVAESVEHLSVSAT
ncbi:Pinin [Thelohanellus kitauei]|uniref:Pinin n=1 Tax=Thelohanellus kitauei TaxID=669202 RepID=A0A0C2J550_THEKT|nr:Pinin [Thelohanellus kitauei]